MCPTTFYFEKNYQRNVRFESGVCIMRKPVSSCLCGCHYQGVGYCERCSRFHQSEWTLKETVEDNRKQKQSKYFRKPRRKF